MKSIKLWLNRDKPKVSQFKFGNLFKCIKGYFLIIFSSFLQALKLTAANFSFQYSLSKAAACMAAASAAGALPVGCKCDPCGRCRTGGNVGSIVQAG